MALKVFSILVIVLASSQLNHKLIRETSHGAVRVSAFTTLLFVSLNSFFDYPERELLNAAFLGASFLGMSDHNLFGPRDLFFAGWIFALLFYFVLPMNVGLGGALGTAAFISCLIIRTCRIIVGLKNP